MASAADRPDRYEDERGVIQDLLGPVDAITRIFTVTGAVRGNHMHRFTEQYTYVVSGRLLAVCLLRDGGRREVELPPGQLLHEPAGVPHAWQALADTTVLVFTKGPRAGTAYETDTIRLEEPILTPAGTS